jgi:hypothetical protein
MVQTQTDHGASLTAQGTLTRCQFFHLSWVGLQCSRDAYNKVGISRIDQAEQAIFASMYFGVCYSVYSVKIQRMGLCATQPD